MDNSSFNGHVQSGGDHRNHPDSEKVRRFMQKTIYEYLILRGKQQSTYLSEERMINLTRLIDEALFDAASSLDEYMNLDTLEHRLISYLKQLRDREQNKRLVQQVNSGLANLNLNLNQNQESLQHENSSGNSSTMILNPGGVSQLTSGMGCVNGDQQPAASVFPTTSGSSNMGSSMDGGEGTPTQMNQVKEENY